MALHPYIDTIEPEEGLKRLNAALTLYYASHGKAIDGHQIGNILNGRWWAVSKQFGGEA